MDRINVVDDSGELKSIPTTQLEEAQKQGYRPASPQEAAKHFESQEYDSPLKAGLAGAARALTFGGSDVALTATGLAKPETLQKLEEYNPAASTVGELGAIGASLLVPGYGEATAAAREVSMAGNATRAITAPIRTVAELGQSITAGTAANIGATTTLGKIAAGATAAATGAAAESALYGIGQSISEAGMGKYAGVDLPTAAESVMAHAGLSAVLGGGLGGLFGLGSEVAGKTYAKLFPGVSSPSKIIEDTIPEFGHVGREIDMVNRSAEERASFEAARNKLKKNADEIGAAALMLDDAPVTEGMLSGSEHFQRIEQGIRNRGTPVGVAIQEQYNKGWQATSKKINEMLGPETKTSLSDLGSKLKTGISEKFEQQLAPIQDLYAQIKEFTPHFDVSIPQRKTFGKDIMKIADQEGLTPSMAQHKYLSGISKDMMHIDTLQKLQNFRTALGKEVSPETRYISGVVRDKLNDIEDKIVRGSLKQVLPEEQQAFADDILNKMSEAKSKYRDLREKMAKVGKNVLGKRKIYGPQDFLDALEDGKTTEQFAKALLKRENSEFMGFVQKEFPNEFQEIMNFHRQELRESALRGGEFNPRAALKNINDLEPQMQNMLFGEGEKGTLRAADIYLKAFPPNFNPSGTSAAEAYQRWLGGGVFDAVKAIGAMGYDAAQKARVGMAAKRVQDVHTLVGMEKAVVKSVRAIQSGAKMVFDAKDRAIPFGASSLAEKMLPHDEIKKTISQIKEAANNPEYLIDRLGKNTEGLAQAAPETTQNLQATATRAVQYLAMGAPDLTSPYPLGDNPEPSPIELNVFAEKLHFLKNPNSVFKEIAGGTLVPEHIEALSMVYPSLYKNMQTAVMNHMVDAISKKKKINYRTKNMLSLFLNQDLDSSVTSDSIMKNQIAISKIQQRQQDQANQMSGAVRPSQTGLGHLNKNTQTMTPMQKSSQRIEG